MTGYGNSHYGQFPYGFGESDVLSQTITGFGAIADHAFGDPDFAVNVGVSATSGLPVVFTAIGNCTVTSDGSVVHITGAGPCTIYADQPGNATYAPAPQVSRSFNVTVSGDNVITFAPIADHVYGEADFFVTASASSGLDVNFTASGHCAVSSDLNTATVHITGAGPASVTAHQPGTIDIAAAAPVTRAFTIAKADQTIDFGPIPGRIYGDDDFSVFATATSGLAVRFAATGDCTVTTDGSVVHILGPGLGSITATQPGNANYNAAVPVTRDFAIVLLDFEDLIGVIERKSVITPAAITRVSSGVGVIERTSILTDVEVPV